MRILILLVTLLVPAVSLAGEPRVFLRKGDSGAHVVVDNPLDCPITITIDLERQENVSPSRPLPVTVIVPPRAERTALALRAERPREEWSVEARTWHQLGSADAVTPPGLDYELPYRPGASFVMSQGYDGRFSHDGVNALDFTMPEGTEVCAARGGVVVGVADHFTESGKRDDLKDKANHVLIGHDDGTMAAYTHLQSEGVLVEVGQRVRAGDVIARSGATGYVSGPHLHFEVFRPIDGKDRETLQVTFRTSKGSGVSLIEGHRYTRPDNTD